ncbi:hypothetical protein [Bacillus wiedmannii]|uniref:hypothetical protein n=1 Tax=Bacillus wiedmannii TaxID=1890302 RepID=UPI000BF10233|nr:hypothetical protein [Bacillus wiedmannii]PEN61640.1 hypothetical protein CN576_21660 [Bacillus wiedmannii]PHA62884.1 hypothetical protein COE75_16760 [Bacillus wiedmannii]
MKKLTYKLLSKLKINEKKEETIINLSRNEDEVTVDLGQIVVTGTPENIAVFMTEMTKMTLNNQKGMA